jgi:hypothetical protein
VLPFFCPRVLGGSADSEQQARGYVRVSHMPGQSHVAGASARVAVGAAPKRFPDPIWGSALMTAGHPSP